MADRAPEQWRRDQERRAKLRRAEARAFDDPGRLQQGAMDALGTVGSYLSAKAANPRSVGADLRTAGGAIYDAIKEDPMGFVGDAIFAPLSGFKDFAEVRQAARDARAAGDAETAGKLEQAAVLAGLSAIPLAGPIIGRGAKALGRGVKLAVKGVRGAERAADAGGDTALRRMFSVTPEETPGHSTGHRPDIKNADAQTRARYQGAAPWLRDREDVLYKARGIPTRTQTGTGAYVNSAGELEMNPVNVTGLSMPDAESRLPEIEAIEKLRGVIDAQEAMAGNMPMPDTSGNALFFNMGRLPTEKEMAFLAEKTPGGFGSTATTGGALTFPFDPGMGGEEAQAAMAGWRDLASRYLGTEPTEARNAGFYTPAMGRFDEDYNIVPTAPFSGEATMGVLEDFAKLDPSVARDIAGSPDVRDVLQQKYLRDAGAPTARQDIQNTRQFFADPRWEKAVELIRQGMPPAAALAALGYSASALAGETPQ